MKCLLLGALSLLSGILLLKVPSAIAQTVPCDPTLRCLTEEQLEAISNYAREENERVQQERLEELQQLTGTETGTGYNWSFRLTVKDGAASWNCNALAVNAQEGNLAQINSTEVLEAIPVFEEQTANVVNISVLTFESNPSNAFVIGDVLAGDTSDCFQAGAAIWRRQSEDAQQTVVGAE